MSGSGESRIDTSIPEPMRLTFWCKVPSRSSYSCRPMRMVSVRPASQGRSIGLKGSFRVINVPAEAAQAATPAFQR